MTKHIGLFVGREWSFPPAFIEEVARRDAGVVAEYVSSAPGMDEPVPYAVIIDRISHEVPYYRTYLKHAVLQGRTVVNNPFMWTADDKFFGASLATKLGSRAARRRWCCPTRTTSRASSTTRACATWSSRSTGKRIVDYVGLPCVLKDAHGGGWTRRVRLPHAWTS